MAGTKNGASEKWLLSCVWLKMLLREALGEEVDSINSNSVNCLYLHGDCPRVPQTDNFPGTSSK